MHSTADSKNASANDANSEEITKAKLNQENKWKTVKGTEHACVPEVALYGSDVNNTFEILEDADDEEANDEYEENENDGESIKSIASAVNVSPDSVESVESDDDDDEETLNTDEYEHD